MEISSRSFSFFRYIQIRLEDKGKCARSKIRWALILTN